MNQCPQCLWVGTHDQMEVDGAGIHLCPTCYVPFGPDWGTYNE